VGKLDLITLRERHLTAGRPLSRDLESSLRADPRKDAAKLLKAILERRRDNRAEGQRLRHMGRYEARWIARGIVRIAGVDEAGMSPLAGPVVAGAVILKPRYKLRDLDDSKKVAPETREWLAEVIRRDAIAWAFGTASVEEIDTLNIYHAGLLAMRRAVLALSEQPEVLLIDARQLKDLDVPQEAIIKGDEKSASIAAASIIAKTTRDGIMRELHARFPMYGFAKHKGYGVPEHYLALRTHGACEIHRRSFPVVQKILSEMREVSHA
jgi:ribonuclease HII